MQGYSVIKMKDGINLHEYVVAETDWDKTNALKALITKDGWKLVINTNNDEKELFNLKEDNKENNNLYQKQLLKSAELEEKLLDWLCEIEK